MIFLVRCFNEGRVVRTELCTSLWEADIKAEELKKSQRYEMVKIVNKQIGDDDAELV